MNNYFGIGLDAKISLDFNHKRDEHPEKCRWVRPRVLRPSLLRRLPLGRLWAGTALTQSQRLVTQVPWGHRAFTGAVGVLC